MKAAASPDPAAGVETQRSKQVDLQDLEPEELKKMEKKAWIEMKDMIFSTDENILDHLNSHCAHWRRIKRHELDNDNPNNVKNQLTMSKKAA